MDSRDVDRCILSLLLRIARFLECTFCQICFFFEKKRKGKKRKNIPQKRRAFKYESALMNLESDRNELITFISFGENDKRTLYPLFTNIFVPKDVVYQRPR